MEILRVLIEVQMDKTELQGLLERLNGLSPKVKDVEAPCKVKDPRANVKQGLDLIRGGATVSKAAKMMGVSRSLMEYYARKAGLAPKKHREKIDKHPGSLPDGASLNLYEVCIENEDGSCTSFTVAARSGDECESVVKEAYGSPVRIVSIK